MIKNKQKLRALLFSSLLIVGGMIATTPTFAEIAIITSNSNSLSSITAGQAAAIWLGKSKSVGDSGVLKAIDLPEGNAARNEFYSKVVKKTPKQLKVYWRKQVFTGRAFPPKSVNSADEVKKWVSSSSNGLGYIDASAVDSSVKVLLKID